MKIALFIPDLFGGGAQRMVVNMAITLAKAGHDVDLVLGRREGTYDTLIPETLNVVDFKKKRITGALFPLVKYLKTAKPDILMSALTHTNIIAIAAKLLLPKSKTKFVVTERNHFSSRTKNSGGKREALNTFLMPLFYPHADAVVGISKGVAQDIVTRAKITEGKIGYIHNPVATDDLIKEAESDQAINPQIEKWINSSNTPLLVTSGRFVDQKDHSTLIEAFALLQDEIECRLILLSEGPLQGELEDQATALGVREKLYFTGFIDHSLSIMKRCDLFVLSSRWEGFGNVLVEALLCGLSIVSTDCPAGPAEILEDGKYGHLVPMQDPQSLSEAMAIALKTPHDPAVQKQRALHFKSEKICKDYEALFKNLLEGTL